MNTTDKLTEILRNSRPEGIDSIFAKYWAEITQDEKPFAAYMRTLLKAKGTKQAEAFIRADIPEHYGYWLISEERHTRQRDVILRLCFGGGLTLDETQKALKLYGLAPLYPKIARDAVLMVALNSSLHDVHDVDSLLKKHGMKLLEKCGAAE